MYGSRSDGGKLPAELLIKPPIRRSLSRSVCLFLPLAHTKDGEANGKSRSATPVGLFHGSGGAQPREDGGRRGNPSIPTIFMNMAHPKIVLRLKYSYEPFSPVRKNRPGDVLGSRRIRTRVRGTRHKLGRKLGLISAEKG